jgi:non-specific serine/threonine protein kinase
MDDSSKTPLVEPLTQREREILGLLADGLTNREIADRLYLSHETVKWYNKQLYGKLGVSNRTQAAAKAQDYALQEYQQPASAKRTAYLKHNLPAPLTSFIGRQRELEEVASLLEESRLLTLTGPAGTGKTRLALQVAAQVLEDFVDGVYLVELAPLKDSALVADTVARTLGIKEIEGQPIIDSLLDYLRNRTLLLLADNFEHVIESAPVAADLLSACPGLKVLITSREALGLYGEQEYPVAPLALPNLDHSESLATLSQYEAVSLFVQRAQSVKPNFSLTDKNAATVAEICVRLDGLPLAIELAAARVWIFSPQILLEQLESRFTALRSQLQDQLARHETLLAAIAWSYDLLDEAEKLLFARLSVFRGGCSIEAAREICAHNLSIDILSGMESLLRKNLLRQIEGTGGELRFDMLETIHEYARDQLDRMGKTYELRSRHAEYFAALVEHRRSASRGGPNQLQRLDQLETEHDNIRDALEWSLGSDKPLPGLRLVGSLGHFWFRKGHYAEAQRWTSVALDLDARFDAPPPVRAALLHAAGVVAHFSDERDKGRQLHLGALELYRELDDDLETGWLLVYLGAQSFGQTDQFKEALAYVEEGLDLLQRVNDRAGIAQALHVIGELARHSGEHERAIEAFTEGLSIARELGDVLREILILDSLTYIAIYDDDVEKAAALSYEAFTLTIEVDHRPHIPAAIAAAAAVSMAEGFPDRAARLIGASQAVFEAHGFTPRPSDMPDISRTMSVVQDALGSASFEAARAKGREMSMEEAIDYALSGATDFEISSK